MKFNEIVEEHWSEFCDQSSEEFDWITDEYFICIDPVMAAGDLVVQCDDDRADKLDAVRVEILKERCWDFFAGRIPHGCEDSE